MILDQVERELKWANPRPGGQVSVTVDVRELHGIRVAGFSHRPPLDQLYEWCRMRGLDLIVSQDRLKAEIIRHCGR